ncbi:heavy-metal-associated domain-containing protein [Candidatus Bipolaricaulota bacterium]
MAEETHGKSGAGQAKTAVLSIEGMSCMGCAKSVESAATQVAGVLNVNVNLEAGQAAVEYDPGSVGLREIRKAIVTAGFKV